MARVDRDEAKREALRYMELLQMDVRIRQDFMEKGTVYLSFGEEGAVRVLNEVETERVAQVEKEYNGMILVYHAIQSRLLGEDMLTLLTVSRETEEWDAYFTSLNRGWVLTYGYVQSALEEGIGSVVISPAAGAGAVRQG